MQNLEVDMP